eukprot:TRINITY_DN41645_c0_g1_i2.p1 TRINITY_DN41645_c0_g1~~TRINITY_DN41645_c0_g1_i2.p1  ORF type:complete len:631 (+),score=86.45 TRINITY_DN41645_c0_g1_i2:87-1979(+)
MKDGDETMSRSDSEGTQITADAGVGRFAQAFKEMKRLHKSGSSVTEKRKRSRSCYRAEGLLEQLKESDKNHFVDIVLSPYFDLAIAIVIVLNTVLVGVEQSYDLQARYPEAMLVIESAFLLIYMMELSCRFKAFGVFRSLKDDWVKMDVFLLVSGITFTWVLCPYLFEGMSAPVMNVGVLKTARIFRLARMLRLVIKFRSLWMLMQGLLNSAQTMFSVLVVLTIIVYMFACIGFDVIGGHGLLSDPHVDENFAYIVKEHFSSLPATMLTILSFLVFDSVREIYWPLVTQDPVLMLYFLAVIFTVGIVLANLITAVMVNGSIEQASQNREAKLLADKYMQETILKETMDVFRSLDQDCSGVITREEVQGISEVDAAIMESLIHLRDPVELIDVLDLDDSGAVDMEEFIKVVQQVACHPGESIQFLKLAKTMKQMHSAILCEHRKLASAITSLTDKVARLSKEPLATPPPAPPPERSNGFGACKIVSEDFHPVPLDVESGGRRQDSHDAKQHRLAESTPDWASMIYQELKRDLDLSTSNILQALYRDPPGSPLVSPPMPNARDTDKVVERDPDGGKAFLSGLVPSVNKVGGDSIAAELVMPLRPPSLPPCGPSPKVTKEDTRQCDLPNGKSI